MRFSLPENAQNTTLYSFQIRYIFFDIERALSMVGTKTLETALAEAKSDEAKTWLNNTIFENEKLKASDSKFPEISYCLENYYKTSSRRKRSLPYDIHNYRHSHNSNEEQPHERKTLETARNNTALSAEGTPLQVFSTRKLLSTNNPSFEEVENEILLNDPVSAAFGTGVCRYCLSACPEK